MTRRGKKRWVDLGGDEISRWGSWEWAEPPDPETYIDEFDAAMRPRFWEHLEEITARCAEILEGQGFPHPTRHVNYWRDGGWWYLDSPGAPDRAELMRALREDGRAWGGAFGWEYALGRSEPFSETWYAARVAKLIWLVSRDREASHTVQLARIMQIGSTMTDWRWRRGFKPSILTGRKQRKVLADHRGTANERRRQEVQARRGAISLMLGDTKLTGGALERYLQRRLEDEAGIAASLRTIRRDLSGLSSA